METLCSGTPYPLGVQWDSIALLTGTREQEGEQHMWTPNTKFRTRMARCVVWRVLLLAVALAHVAAGVALAQPTSPPRLPVELLTVALEQQIRVNALLTAPALDQDVP